MVADFTLAGRPSPDSAAAAEKMVAVTMVCDCCTGYNFADPCTLCSNRKRSRCHTHSLPNKKATFFSVDSHHAAAGDSRDPTAVLCSSGFVPTCSPGAARVEEGGLLQTSISEGSKFSSNCTASVLQNSAIVPKELFSSRPTAVATIMNCGEYHNVSPASPPLNGTSGQSFASPNKNVNGLYTIPPSPLHMVSSGQFLTPPTQGAANFHGQSGVVSPDSGGPSQCLAMMEQDKVSPVVVLIGDQVNVTKEESLVRICFSCPSCGDNSQVCIET